MRITDFVSFINNVDFNDIFAYLLSPESQKDLLLIKVIFIIITAVLLGLMMFFTMKTHYLQWLFIHDATQFVTMRPFGAKRITKQWNKILKYLDGGNEAEYKLAVLEADDILDASLKRMGYAGRTLEEKLNKLTSATLPSIQQVYEIHHLRNKIVYEPDFRLSLDEAKKTLDVYGQAFVDLQILEK